MLFLYAQSQGSLCTLYKLSPDLSAEHVRVVKITSLLCFVVLCTQVKVGDAALSISTAGKQNWPGKIFACPVSGDILRDASPI